MRLLFFSALLSTNLVFSQPNTSANKPAELAEWEWQMIEEINLLRKDPAGYIAFIKPYHSTALEMVKKYGKGSRNYALTISTSTVNGVTQQKVDTTWHYTNLEELKAIESLIADLKKLAPLSQLKYHPGIYKAACLFAADQQAHQWELMHTGSDGSQPWDRITKHAPDMRFGNENLAANMPCRSPRETVIQLLIDSGIPSYGHRYNLLNAAWTHVACKRTEFKSNYCWWIQNFGQVK
ncbi:MAG TPA: hypothetical protein PKD90_12745 [Phnomibacter sp.]|nr:hypothetical protein [Phnomibacter sp.]